MGKGKKERKGGIHLCKIFLLLVKKLNKIKRKGMGRFENGKWGKKERKGGTYLSKIVCVYR